MINGKNTGLAWSMLGLCAVAMLPLLGCGGSGDVAGVEGTVTLDGAPLADAAIVFQPEGGRPSSGRTDAQGHYTLEYTATESGAQIGKHKVMITTAGMEEDATGNLVEVKETLPAKYHEKTELTAEVTGGSNTIDFELTSK